MRDTPAFVYRVAMKAAAELIMKSAGGHSIQALLSDVSQPRPVWPVAALEQEVDYRRVRKFGGLAKPPMHLIKAAFRRSNHGIDHPGIEYASRIVKQFGLGDGCFESTR